ncbi:glycosyltransferase family 2 protein [Cyanobium sp. ATX 6F1]|uniref:glycosyltransferase family 2 protein n=1 Tax=Cyanobium sp. ATX 6F1 TaxID=2823702 RepID=UPI0020CBA959|nr:glycosyltransferase family 2 protein [Cyanobium sp. ATX 6F1]
MPEPSTTNPEHWYRQGAQALGEHQLEAAAQAFWSCLAIDPRHASALHLLGKVRERQGEFEAALALQLGSWREDPSLGWNAFAAAELLRRDGRWGEAAAAFRAAQEVLPDERWIALQAREAEGLGVFAGERLAGGLSAAAYRIWCRSFEPVLSPPAAQGSGGDRAVREAWHLDCSPEAVLHPGALDWLAGWLAAQPDRADLLYPDEDQLDGEGRRHDPWFKPGWVSESFWSTPWLGSCAFWRRDWLHQQGLSPLPPGADPLERWRWQLAALERRPRIAHLDRVLVHLKQGPAQDPAPYATALADHLGRCGEGPVHVEPGPATGFRLTWPVPRALRLSVVVLTRDRPDLLEQCLHGVEASKGGLDLEWLVVDNGSRLEATAALLRHWRQRPGSRFRVRSLDQPFNWSLLNNRAAAEASGELLLFLNNDVLVPAGVDQDWLKILAGQALRPAIGCVGARLLYPDGTIQHAGLLPLMGAGCEHPYRGLPLERAPHRGRLHQLTGWPAVTGACLMLRRGLFQAVGGFDPALPVEGNDVDFCLRLGRAGYRHVVCPEATLLHLEAASRSLSTSATWAPAQSRLMRRWPGAMASASPWWPEASSLETTDGRPRELAGRGWS